MATANMDVTVAGLDSSAFPASEKSMLRLIPWVITMVFMMMMGGLYVAATGVMMQAKVPMVEAQFHSQIDAYFANSKQVRDSAETGSQLNKDLAELKKFPSKLLELKLVGVGRILTGIFVILFGIQGALVMMPYRIRKVLRQLQQQK